jgi:hypothetical protein
MMPLHSGRQGSRRPFPLPQGPAPPLLFLARCFLSRPHVLFPICSVGDSPPFQAACFVRNQRGWFCVLVSTDLRGRHPALQSPGSCRGVAPCRLGAPPAACHFLRRRQADAGDHLFFPRRGETFVTRPLLRSGRDTTPWFAPSPTKPPKQIPGHWSASPSGQVLPCRRSGETPGQKIKQTIIEAFPDRAGQVQLAAGLIRIGVPPLSPQPAPPRRIDDTLQRGLVSILSPFMARGTKNSKCRG